MADAQLHQVIARLLQGVDAMRAKGEGGDARREEGVHLVIAALASYAEYFDADSPAKP